MRGGAEAVLLMVLDMGLCTSLAVKMAFELAWYDRRV